MLRGRVGRGRTGAARLRYGRAPGARGVPPRVRGAPLTRRRAPAPRGLDRPQPGARRAPFRGPTPGSSSACSFGDRRGAARGAAGPGERDPRPRAGIRYGVARTARAARSALRARRRLVEVAGAQPEELASFAQREHLGGAPAASFVAQHGDAAAPSRPDDHVARLEALDRIRRPPGRAAPAPFGVHGGAETSVVVDVARASPRRVAVPSQELTAPLELSLERDDVTVRRYCANDRFSRWCATSGGIPRHEVRGHVVRRPERRAQRVRAADASDATWSKGTNGLQQHDRVPDVVDPAPPGAPGELRVFAGREELVLLTRELRQLLDHHRPGGHVDPERQRLRGEHHLHQAGTERLLDRFLHRGDHPGVMRGEAGLEAGEPFAVPRTSRSSSDRASVCASAMRRIAGRSSEV